MAFILHSTDDGRVPPTEYLPCGAITPKVGMALVQSAGNLAIATGTNAPAYISVTEKAAACTAGELIGVIRVGHDMVFETTNSAQLGSAKQGAKVTMHASNGMQVTGTTSGGVAELVGFDPAAATASGKPVLVRF